MHKISEDEFQDICSQLSTISDSLKGLGGLFTQVSKDICLEDTEFYGLGLLFQNLSAELNILEDTLRDRTDRAFQARLRENSGGKSSK